MNPYPCGFYCDSQKACTCGPSTVTKYQKRISGPLLDRTDIDIEVPRVDYKKLSSTQVGETSASIRQRVQTARDIQNQRFSRCGLQCRYARRGGKAILQPPARRRCTELVEVSEFDASSHESTQSIGTRLSSHPQTIPHHRRLGGE